MTLKLKTPHSCIDRRVRCKDAHIDKKIRLMEGPIVTSSQSTQEALFISFFLFFSRSDTKGPADEEKLCKGCPY